MGLEKRGYMLGGSYFIDDGEDALYIEFPEGKVKYVPERTCKVRQSYFDSDDELRELMECVACSPEDTVVCICDTCKHDWRYDRGIRPNYCPNCGAKVVE